MTIETSKTRLLAIAGIASLLTVMNAPRATAQPAQAFDAASIKPNDTGVRTGYSISTEGAGRFTARNMSLRLLIQLAWGLQESQLAGGPKWLDQDRYDISATSGSPGKISDKALEPLLQALLVDRFKLKIHRETKELPVYSLVVRPSGQKLVENTSQAVNHHIDVSSSAELASFRATNTSMADLADALGRTLGRIVIDNTGLPEKFDFTLTFAPDQAAESSGPSLFTAIQEQLGLKLESTKGPVQVIIVDSAEKPSEN